MKITEQALLGSGFKRHSTQDGGICYVKGNIALVHNTGLWIPCYYAAGTPLAEKLYVETMEEVELLQSNI